MKATVTYSIDGTVQPPMEITGGHLSTKLLYDHPGDMRGSVMVCNHKGGPIQRHVIFREAWLIDKEIET